MNRKLLPLYALVVISVGLFWAKWKRENPTPSELDLGARARLIADSGACIRPIWLNGEKGHSLSRQEREEIANHLWMLPARPAYENGSEGIEIRWGGEHIVIARGIENDYYASTVIDLKNNYDGPTQYQCHPATGLFLRRWLANRADITRGFAWRSCSK